MEHMVNLNRTLFTMVKDQAVVDRIIAATEDVVGNLDTPNTGILAVFPIAQVYGLNRRDE
jgi:hypothetical protein